EFSAGVPVVYIASGTGYADALSAAPAAARQGGPLLLVPPTSVPAVVVAELQRLKPALIVVVGSAGAVSAQSYAHLAELAPDIRRDGGADRYATSRAVIERAFSSSASAFVATGENFPDALSASAAAGSIGAPVLLVKGRSSSISSPEAALLRTLSVTKVTVVGAASVVSAGIENSLRTVAGVDVVVRAAGADRYATAVRVNELSFTDAQRAFFAVGTGFADALAGAALAGAVGAPLYVVPKTCVSGAVRNQLSSFGTTGYTLLGGSDVLSDAVGALTVCPVVVPPAPPKPPTPPAPPKNPGDTKNCGDFATYAAALAWFKTYFPLYGDVARLDQDNDGIPCESLPGAP
ncbi:MAG: cell wall-binding repeat-containing protein, partial [Mycetocola sp.]